MPLINNIIRQLQQTDRLCSARLIALYKGGESVAVLAEQFQMHRRVIVELVKGIERE